MGRYMEQIGGYPILTREQEADLLARMSADPSDPSRQDLVRSHLRFVISVAKKYKNRGLSMEDLISEGNVGLLRAALRFEPRRGVRFMTCAVWWIRKAIREALDRNAFLVRIPDNRLRALRLHKAEADASAGRSESGADRIVLSRRMSFTSPEMEELLALAKHPVRLDPGEPPGEKGRPLDFLVDRQAPDPRAALERKEARARIHQVLARLTPGERVVVEHRYGLKDDEPRTLDQIGRELGVSRERVHQVEIRAKQRLRRFLTPEKKPPAAFGRAER